MSVSFTGIEFVIVDGLAISIHESTGERLEWQLGLLEEESRC